MITSSFPDITPFNLFMSASCWRIDTWFSKYSSLWFSTNRSFSFTTFNSASFAFSSAHTSSSRCCNKFISFNSSASRCCNNTVSLNNSSFCCLIWSNFSNSTKLYLSITCTIVKTIGSFDLNIDANTPKIHITTTTTTMTQNWQRDFRASSSKQRFCCVNTCFSASILSTSASNASSRWCIATDL